MTTARAPPPRVHHARLSLSIRLLSDDGKELTVKKLVMAMFAAACASSALLLVTPAHAEWVPDGLTYTIQTNGNVATSSGGTGGSATATNDGGQMSVHATASNGWTQGGITADAYGNEAFTYHQAYRWNGTDPATQSFSVPFTEHADGTITTTGSGSSSYVGATAGGSGGGPNAFTITYGTSSSPPSSPYPVSASGTTAVLDKDCTASAHAHGNTYGTGSASVSANASITLGTPY